jgi:hypothetical protein
MPIYTTASTIAVPRQTDPSACCTAAVRATPRLGASDRDTGANSSPIKHTSPNNINPLQTVIVVILFGTTPVINTKLKTR